MKTRREPKKHRTALVFVLGLLVGAGGAVVFTRQSTPVAAPSASAAVASAPRPAANLTASNANNGGKNNGNQGNAQQPPKSPPDPQARAALALVGADPAAEEYWFATINNPDVPSGERKKLIEDLADVGYTNVLNPTPADLQLIAYRLQLVGQLAQNPLDQTNAKALASAQKDLTKTATRVLAQSQP